MKCVKDKLAVVTGAGSGIGRATSLRLATAGCDFVPIATGSTAGGSGTLSGAMATMAYSLLDGDLVILVCGRQAPSQSEWRAYAGSVKDMGPHLRGTGRSIKFIVFADEAGPDATQRAFLVEALQGLTTRTAVISDSLVARCTITAFGWLSLSIKGFAPTQLSAAATYLALSNEQLSDVISRAPSLAPKVGGSRCVELAVGAQQAVARRR
jgi:hypothetical protein